MRQALLQHGFMQLGRHFLEFLAEQHLAVQSGLQVLPAAWSHLHSPDGHLQAIALPC